MILNLEIHSLQAGWQAQGHPSTKSSSKATRRGRFALRFLHTWLKGEPPCRLGNSKNSTKMVIIIILFLEHHLLLIVPILWKTCFERQKARLVYRFTIYMSLLNSLCGCSLICLILVANSEHFWGSNNSNKLNSCMK